MKRLSVLLLSLVLISACGDDEAPKLGNQNNGNNANNSNNANNGNNANNLNNTGGCTDDQECAAGFACVESSCEASCSETRSCRDDEMCIDQPDGDGMYCVAAPNNTQNNVNNVNNSNNSNNQPGPRAVLITDSTVDQAACDSTEPGSDIYFVRIEDSTGTVQASGTAVRTTPGMAPNGNNFDDEGNIDGTTPPAGMCPTAGNNTLYSMGCSGAMVVTFQSGAAAYELQNGDVLRVFEFGSQCQDSNADVFSAFVCTDSAEVMAGTYTSCTIPVITNGADNATGTISL